MKKTHVAISDDYAVLNTDTHAYYFGYEELYCPVCDTFFECGDEECNHDDDFEWAFTSRKFNEDKPTYMRVEDFEFGYDMGEILLECIGRFSKLDI